MPTSQELQARNYFVNFFVKLFSKTNCMKTNSPNLLFNHQTNLLFVKTSQVMKQKLLLILMLVSFVPSLFAQGTRSGTIIVTPMSSIFSSSGNSVAARAGSASTAPTDTQRLRSLIDNVQPSSYYYGGEVKTYGDLPTNLYTDASSLRQVDTSISLKQNVELVTIVINTATELNSNIDLAVFSNFPNLKYIYFISNVNTTSDIIASHLVNYDSRFSLYYKIDRGDKNQ